MQSYIDSLVNVNVFVQRDHALRAGTRTSGGTPATTGSGRTATRTGSSRPMASWPCGTRASTTCPSKRATGCTIGRWAGGPMITRACLSWGCELEWRRGLIHNLSLGCRSCGGNGHPACTVDVQYARAWLCCGCWAGRCCLEGRTVYTSTCAGFVDYSSQQGGATHVGVHSLCDKSRTTAIVPMVVTDSKDMGSEYLWAFQF